MSNEQNKPVNNEQNKPVNKSVKPGDQTHNPDGSLRGDNNNPARNPDGSQKTEKRPA